MTYKHKIFKTTIKMSIYVGMLCKSQKYLHSFLYCKLQIVILLQKYKLYKKQILK